MNRLIFIIILGFLVVSCKKDDYYYFSDDELNLISYEEGDKFDFIVLPQNDTLACEVKTKEFKHKEINYALHINSSFCHVCDIDVEMSNNMNIALEFIKSLEGFSFNIYTLDKVSNWNNAFFFQSETIDFINYIDSVEVNKKWYDNVIPIISLSDTLYYSGEFGIVKFTINEQDKKYVLKP
ncbi:MAG: hypothetical protein JXR50_05740 [Prolixibacteraceae bacterium]|nr:hypothetical protein [Prolixibacteraceae bacterium]